MGHYASEMNNYEEKKKLKVGDTVVNKQGKKFIVESYDKENKLFMIKEKEHEKPIEINNCFKCKNCRTIYESYEDAYECCMY